MTGRQGRGSRVTPRQAQNYLIRTSGSDSGGRLDLLSIHLSIFALARCFRQHGAGIEGHLKHRSVLFKRNNS